MDPITTPTEVPTETPAVDSAAPPVEPTAPAKEPEFVSDKFAQLAKREKGIVKLKQGFAAEKAEFDQQRQQFAKEKAEYDRWLKMRENAKIDPDAYLNEAGLSYGYLTERALKGGTKDPAAYLEAANKRIEELEKKLAADKEADRAAQVAAANKEWEERLTNFNMAVGKFVEQNKDEYELINLHGQTSLVIAVLDEARNRKMEMTPKEAAQKVENHLREQIDKTLTTAKAFKDKYVPKPAEEKKPTEGSPTLTNSLNSQTGRPNGAPMTEREREQRALAALNAALGES